VDCDLCRLAAGNIKTRFYYVEYESVREKPRKILDHEHYHIEGARYIGK